MGSAARWMVRGVGALVVLAIIGGGLAWWASRPDDPDAFYDTPSDVPSSVGVVVRSERFDRGVPDGADAWRILYTTTVADGSSTVASATVLVPAAPSDGTRPVLAWAHGTTGVERGCAPSVLDQPWGGIPALAQVIDAGWVVVATDYVGLGGEGRHQYLVGDSAARNVLDSVRALDSLAEQEPDVFAEGPVGDEVVVWGHSQGGHSALFTGQEFQAYAPEIDLVGVGAVAPATDLKELLAAAEDEPVGKVLSALAMVSWDGVYPEVDLDEVIRPAARPIVRDIASRCLVAPAALVTLVEAEALRRPILAVDPADEPLASLLEQNTPRGPIDLPIFVAQGDEDEVVAPDVTAGFVDALCAAGEVVDGYTYPGMGHLPIVEPGSPVEGDLMAWTEARFAGVTPDPGCRRTDR